MPDTLQRFYPVAQLPSTIAVAVGKLDGNTDPFEILAGCFQATLDAVFIDWHELHRTRGMVDAKDWPALDPPDCAKDRLEFDAEMMRMCEGMPDLEIEGHLRPEFVGPSTRAFGNVWTI